MITPITLPCPGAHIAAAARATLPMLVTQRLILRAPEVEDFALFKRLFQLPSAKYMGEMPDDEAIWAQFTNYVAGWVLRGDGMFTVCMDGAPVGFVFAGVEPGDQAIELGFFIAPEHQGAGIAFEAASAALAHLKSLAPSRSSAMSRPAIPPAKSWSPSWAARRQARSTARWSSPTRWMMTAARRPMHDPPA